MNQEECLHRLQVLMTRPLAYEVIARELGMKTIEEKRLLTNLLDKLIQSGELIKTRKDLYAFPRDLNLFVGRIKKNPKGFGFLVSENPDEEDLFIPGNDLNGAMNLDKVIVRILKPAGVNKKTGQTYRAEGEVIRILERHRTQFLGTFERSEHFSFVIPDDPLFDGDIFVAKNDQNEAQDQDKVIVEIDKWPDKKRSAEGHIVEVVGHKDDVGMDVFSIVLRYGLQQKFPDEVEAYANSLPQTVSNKELEGRQDLRSHMLITIDGADAKDLDDAVNVEKLDNGNFLLVTAIADVGHYVHGDSLLDKEAFKRGSSVYLVDRVLPMLPKALSNGICSLNAGEDRLAMVCVMEIDSQGKVLSSEVFEAVINVAYRMTYDNVNAILDGEPGLRKEYDSILTMIEEMKELRDILKIKRRKRGAIDFDIPESFVHLDEQGKPTEIAFRTRGISESMIEEFMLVTNETIAEKLFWLQVPFIYRVHEEPEEEKLDAARDYLQVLGYNLPEKQSLHPKDFQRLLDQVSDDPVSYPINMVLLRSMNHAYYSEESKGHFGLAATYYTHFTSPIRRYSDLAIHRIMKEMIQHHNRISSGRQKALANRVKSYAEQASNTERVAEQAERDSVDLKKVEYMADYVGDTFHATIVSVTGFGFFVQLDNGVEGLVHISTLVDDFYNFNDKALQLVGDHTKKVYKLGQELEVVLTRALVEEAKLDFELIEQDDHRLNENLSEGHEHEHKRISANSNKNTRKGVKSKKK